MKNMKVTKFGHCCLLVEDKGFRILIDPGSYSTSQNDAKNIDIILITHEHGDHLHVESLKTVLKNNPNAKILTNKGVGVILEKEGIIFELLEHKQNKIFGELLIEGFGEKHAVFHLSLPLVDNTGYLISNKLLIPGDAFVDPQKSVEILAVPIIGPWMKFTDAIEYAIKIKPNKFFAVHEGILKDQDFGKRLINMAGNILAKENIELIQLEQDIATEI